MHVKVAVQSVNGGVAKRIDLFLDAQKITSWTAPPYEATIPAAQYANGTLLRATAVTADGQEANDIRMLKGPQTTVEAVRVDVVQLHVSALDKEGRFVKGLAQGDFVIKEDGKPEELTGFEIAENLPLTVGLVVEDLSIYTRLTKEHPEVASYQVMLTAGNNNLGMVFLSTGRLDEAIMILNKAVALHDKLTRERLATKEDYLPGNLGSDLPQPGQGVPSLRSPRRVAGGRQTEC